MPPQRKQLKSQRGARHALNRLMKRRDSWLHISARNEQEWIQWIRWMRAEDVDEGRVRLRMDVRPKDAHMGVDIGPHVPETLAYD